MRRFRQPLPMLAGTALLVILSGCGGSGSNSGGGASPVACSESTRKQFVLDVTREEPLPPDSPLWTAANVVLTQHTSAGSDREAADVVGLFADNLARFLSGRPLRNVVDWSRGY